MITNEIYFFKNQSSVSISDSLYNVNDGVLILQVDGNASNLELSVLGNTDLIDDDFIALKTINATDYSMSDKITSTGIYWIDINGIRKVKLNLSKITGSVNVKALTKRGLTTDLVARAMAANSQSGGCSLEEVKAITGELTDLDTEDKSNLVNAINEALTSGVDSVTIKDNDMSITQDKLNISANTKKAIANAINKNFDKPLLINIQSPTYKISLQFVVTVSKPTNSISSQGMEYGLVNKSGILYIWKTRMVINKNGTAGLVTSVSFTSEPLVQLSTVDYVDTAIANAITTSLEASY